MDIQELNRDFILLNIGYASHDADWNWSNIRSPFARIHYVKSGTAKIIREDGSIEIKPNHLYLTPSYVNHEYVCDSPLELYYLHIYEDVGKNISYFEVIDFPLEIVATEIDVHLIERLIALHPELALSYYDPQVYDTSSNLARNIGRQQKTSLSLQMETQGILKILLSRFIAQAAYKNRNIETRILKTLSYVHKNLDKPIPIDDLAEMCYLTKDHFIRLFRKEMKITPGKYINQKKIEQAQLALLIGDQPIKDIAYNLGFDNIFYFNRLFKKLTGTTPKEYRSNSV